MNTNICILHNHKYCHITIMDFSNTIIKLLILLQTTNVKLSILVADRKNRVT